MTTDDDASSPKVMVTLRVPEGEEPTIEQIMARYHLGPEEIDVDYGVVEIDPRDHLWVVLVSPEAAVQIQPDQGWEARGPYANPRIEPFGPPEADTGTGTETRPGTETGPEGE